MLPPWPYTAILHPVAREISFDVRGTTSLLCSEPSWLPPPSEKSKCPHSGPQSPEIRTPFITSLTSLLPPSTSLPSLASLASLLLPGQSAHCCLRAFALAGLYLACPPLRSQPSALVLLLQDFALMPLLSEAWPPYFKLHTHLCVPILLFLFVCFWPGNLLTSKNLRISLIVFTMCLPS